MTVQEIIYNSKAKKKLQTGGIATGTVEGIQDDLAKKTIRDDTMVARTQGVDGGNASPSLAATTLRKGPAGLLPGSDQQEPLHVIIDSGGGGIGGGGGITGMVNNFAGKMLGKGLGALSSFYKNNISADRNRNKAAQQPIPTAQYGGTLVKKKVPKAQAGGNPWLPSTVASGAGNAFTSFAPNPSAINLNAAGLGTNTAGSLMQSSLHKPPAMAQAPNPKPTGGGGGMSAGQISGIGAQAADLAGNALESLKPVGPFNTWGIETQTKKGNNMSVGASALKGVGKGASMGASIGSIIPGWGTAAGAVIGGAIGGVTGLLKGKKKVKDEAAEIKDNTQLAYEGYHQKANAAQYAALAKHGAKLETMKKLKSAKRNAVSWHGKKFKMKSGGKLDKPGEVNIIPSGTLHKENNNLGQKDKGLPIVDEGGKKIFEVEREELILRLKTTKDVEQFVDSYKKTHNDKHLVDLGKLLSKEIMTNTQDFSGKFGLEAK